MDNKLKNIFSSSECIPTHILNKYVTDLLSEKEKNTIEQHANSCKMCADELEGLILTNNTNIDIITNELNTLVASRVDELNNSKKKRILPLIIRLSAAIIILLLISTVVYFNFFKDSGLNIVLSDNVHEEIPPKPLRQQKDSFETITIVNNENKGKDAGVNKLEEPVISNYTQGVYGNEELAEEISFGYDLSKNISTKTSDENSESDLKKSEIDSDGDSFYNDITTILETEKKTELVSRKIKQDKTKEPKVGKTVIFDATIVTAEDSENIDDIMLLAKKKEKKKEKNKRNREGKVSARKSVSASETYSGDINDNRDKLDRSNNIIDEIATGGAIQNVATTPYSANTQQNNNYLKAKIEFDSENYQEAIKLFEKVMVSVPQHYYALYYSAITYINLNKPEKAITNLDKVLMLPEGEFYNSATWFKAQALILNDKPKQAKIVLYKIIDDNTEFKEKASKVLIELE